MHNRKWSDVKKKSIIYQKENKLQNQQKSETRMTASYHKIKLLWILHYILLYKYDQELV